MFSKATFIATLFAVLAVASADNNQCSTSNQQCCNSVHQAGSAEVVSLQSIVGAAIQLVGDIGVGCSPLLLGGNSCTQQPVCCTDNSFSGLIAIGCTPINLNA